MDVQRGHAGAHELAGQILRERLVEAGDQHARARARHLLGLLNGEQRLSSACTAGDDRAAHPTQDLERLPLASRELDDLGFRLADVHVRRIDSVGPSRSANAWTCSAVASWSLRAFQ